MTNIFIHQGSDKISSINEIKNPEAPAFKPEGGLWLTPEGGKTFYDYLELEAPEESLTMDVSDKNILVVDIMGYINLLSDFREYVSYFGKELVRIDWEKVAQKYDGIFFTEEGLAAASASENSPITGVDFPSLLLFR